MQIKKIDFEKNIILPDRFEYKADQNQIDFFEKSLKFKNSEIFYNILKLLKGLPKIDDVNLLDLFLEKLEYTSEYTANYKSFDDILLKILIDGNETILETDKKLQLIKITSTLNFENSFKFLIEKNIINEVFNNVRILCDGKKLNLINYLIETNNFNFLNLLLDNENNKIDIKDITNTQSVSGFYYANTPEMVDYLGSKHVKIVDYKNQELLFAVKERLFKTGARETHINSITTKLENLIKLQKKELEDLSKNSDSKAKIFTNNGLSDILSFDKKQNTENNVVKKQTITNNTLNAKPYNQDEKLFLDFLFECDSNTEKHKNQYSGYSKKPFETNKDIAVIDYNNLKDLSIKVNNEILDAFEYINFLILKNSDIIHGLNQAMTGVKFSRTIMAPYEKLKDKNTNQALKNCFYYNSLCVLSRNVNLINETPNSYGCFYSPNTKKSFESFMLQNKQYIETIDFSEIDFYKFFQKLDKAKIHKKNQFFMQDIAILNSFGKTYNKEYFENLLSESLPKNSFFSNKKNRENILKLIFASDFSFSLIKMCNEDIIINALKDSHKKIAFFLYQKLIKLNLRINYGNISFKLPSSTFNSSRLTNRQQTDVVKYYTLLKKMIDSGISCVAPSAFVNKIATLETGMADPNRRTDPESFSYIKKLSILIEKEKLNKNIEKKNNSKPVQEELNFNTKRSPKNFI